MGTDVTPEGPEAPRDEKPSRPAGRAGFFTIHKPNQGKPTRLATGAGVALLVGLSMWFLYHEVPAWFNGLKKVNSSANTLWWNITVLVLGLATAALGWWAINRSTSAEFLIATDSEMKKVSWTSRKELWGSTKVVIFFMLMIAGVLFVIDMVFHYLFFLMTVLKFAPFGT